MSRARSPLGPVQLDVLERRVLMSVSTLDPRFGRGGITLTDLGRAEAAEDVLVLANRKILVLGHTGAEGQTERRFVLARYQANGRPDRLFGQNGTVIGDAGEMDARALAVGADGRIVVAGAKAGASGSAAHTDFALIRFNRNGSRDATFGDGGAASRDLNGASNDAALDVAVLEDGRVVAVGSAGAAAGGAGSSFAVARYLATGQPDPAFDGDGLALTDFGQTASVANAMAVQGDGKVVAAGWSGVPGTDRQFSLARFNADGTLDGGFGQGGKAQFTESGRTSEITAVALAPGGGIVAVGHAQGPSAPNQGPVIGPRLPDVDLIVARFHPDGTPDAAFGGDGSVTEDFQEIDSPTGMSVSAGDVAVRGDGSVYVAGGLTFSGGGDLANHSILLARFTPAGAVDTAFATNGRVAYEVSPQDPADQESAAALALQADGRIVIAGTFRDDVALARFTEGQTPSGEVELTADGTLRVVGTGGDDEIVVEFSNAGDAPPHPTVEVLVNGVNRPLFNTAEVLRVDVRGGSGNDRAYVNLPVPKVLDGGAGNDELNAQGAACEVLGGGGNDTLSSGEFNDRLFGGGGRDWLSGHIGDDLLDGGAGNDYLDNMANAFGPGQTDADECVGGTGTDTADRLDNRDTFRQIELAK